MNPCRSVRACCLGLLLLVGACRSEAPPADFSLSLGQGGGFTGQWSTLQVSAQGAVTTSRGGPASTEDAEPQGSLSAEDLAELWQLIRSSQALDSPPNEPGNLSRFLRVTAAGETREAHWAVQVGGSPRPVDALYEQCHAILDRTQVDTPR